jgi:hypothetical protein
MIMFSMDINSALASQVWARDFGFESRFRQDKRFKFHSVSIYSDVTLGKIGVDFSFLLGYSSSEELFCYFSKAHTKTQK